MKRQHNATPSGKTEQKTVSKSPKFKALQSESSSLQTRLIALFITLIVTFVAYYPALDNELTNWDDKQYVVENPHLKSFSGETVKAIFSEKSYMGNYHPLTMLSLNVDYAIGGEDADGNINPYPFHLINVLLHLLVTLLVFQFSYKISGRLMVAFVAGLLFGTHTLHVESVAWVSERKDVLYSVFFVGGLSAYLNYIDKKKVGYFVLSLVLFLLSLLSKGQAVSLAVTLVAIDYFRDRKLFSGKVILEKVPFFLLAIGFGLFAVYAQQQGDAIADEEKYELHKRVGFAGYAFMQYILKLILPVNLSAMYPYPDIVKQTIPAYYWLGLMPSILTIWAFLKTYKTNKPIAFSILFFVINIFLLLQFLPVGSAVHSDRYAYIPSIGFYLLLGFTAQYLLEKKNFNRNILYGITGAYALILTILTMQRSEIWKDSMTLWNDTIAKQPKAVTAWNNRGSEIDRMAKKLADNNDNQQAVSLRMKAILDFTEAIKGKPDYANAMYNRGSSRYEICKVTRDTLMLKDALADFTEAIKYDARFAEAYHNRGNVTAELADFMTNTQKQSSAWRSALQDFDIAIGMKSDDGSFYVNRGVTKGKLGQLDAAIVDFDFALKLGGENESVYSNRGLAKSRIAANYLNTQTEAVTKKFLYYPENQEIEKRKQLAQQFYAEAIADYDKALKIKPKFLTGYYNRAIAYLNSDKPNEAIRDADFALNLDPKFSEAWILRGQAHLKLNDTKQSCMDFAKARELGHPYAQAYLDAYCK